MSRTGSPSLHRADPLRVAWGSLAEGDAERDRGYAAVSGVCARCDVVAEVTPLRASLSENFTGWDALDAAGDGLCESCAWGFRETRLRTRPVIVHREWGALWASRADVTQCLHFALTHEVAVSLPVEGRKHLLPSAEWGAVASDGGVLAWGEPQASLLAVVAWLRARGVRESEFGEPVPPYRVVSLALSDTEATLELMTRWEELRSWQGGPYLAVAVRATRPVLAEEAGGPGAPGAGDG